MGAMKTRHLILLIIMNFFWAASLSIYKALSEVLAPGSIVLLRFGMAALFLVVLWPWLPGAAPRGRDLLKTVIMGLVVFMLGYRIQICGNKLGSAGNSSVLMGMEPIVTSVAAAMFLREHIGLRRWAGFSLGILGMALLNGLWGGGFKWSGLLASAIFIASFLCEAVYSIMGKPLMANAGMLKILTLALLAGTAGNLLLDGPATWTAAQTMPAHFWWLIFYLASICTSIGYAVWFAVIKETDVNITALTIFAQPLAGIIVASVWLHEPLHQGQLWGSLAILAGLVIGLSGGWKRPAKQAAPL
jgi:drug/metabolite transporter (DMT)-like permease